MKSNVRIMYINEIHEENKKFKTTEENTYYIGLNKIGDVWFCIDEINKFDIKIRIAHIEELKHVDISNSKNEITNFINNKEIIKWKIQLKSKSVTIKIGSWKEFINNINSQNFLFVEKINYNAI